ncbi:hypothetical protein ACIBHY_12165 [Nonomuraea sp. NPDC050547]|uniref:hypothetical protein n=1 Tax=Nonomuraea sp. NPDC050547 TaxID=3364368 RepID=UPI0037990B5C
MMRKVRLLLATATGAAVLLGGAGVAATAAGASTSLTARTAAGDITGVSAGNTYVPSEGTVQAGINFTVKDPLGTDPNTTVPAGVTAEISPPGKGARSVNVSYSQPSKGSDGRLPTSAAGTGSFSISSDDPAGDWSLTFKVSRGGSISSDSFTVNVTGKKASISASVTPDPVNLKKGREVQVDVRARVKDAGSVSARLVSDDTSEYYDLGTLSQDGYGIYTGSTFFSDDTEPGTWTLEVTATRGSETFKGEVAFTVNEPEGGVSKKAKSKVTLSLQKKGTKVKAYGKATRAGKAYKGKVLAVYYKAKGAKTYKRIAFVKTDSAGKYSTKVKIKKDGYVKVKVSGTSKTRSAWSPQKFVNIK